MPKQKSKKNNSSNKSSPPPVFSLGSPSNSELNSPTTPTPPSPQEEEEKPGLLQKIRHRVTWKRISADTTEPPKVQENGTYYLPPSPGGRPLRPVPSQATLNHLEREKIVIWRRPLRTLHYFALEIVVQLRKLYYKLRTHKKLVLLAILLLASAYIAYVYPGPHQKFIKYVEKKLIWCVYWLGLGVLSSIGFGTGLHTFLLYLGPHIASVTLAAYECDSLKFPEPPYPDQIICPYEEQPFSLGVVVSLWAIISKVRLEAFMWGAGTALGELPPYFMARAARISGEVPDDDEYREFMQFLELQRRHEGAQADQEWHWMNRAKLYVEKIVERVGFLGILLCASIPNPVFDLAGITCGHFLVPFWTFFGATIIGKAIIKMHIQKLFVVLAFSEHHVEKLVDLLGNVPSIGEHLEAPFREFLEKQKLQLHRKPGDPLPNKSSWLKELFGLIVVLMVVYFLLSIVNSMAQSYHKRLCKRRGSAKS